MEVLGARRADLFDRLRCILEGLLQLGELVGLLVGEVFVLVGIVLQVEELVAIGVAELDDLPVTALERAPAIVVGGPREIRDDVARGCVAAEELRDEARPIEPWICRQAVWPC